MVFMKVDAVTEPEEPKVEDFYVIASSRLVSQLESRALFLQLITQT